MDCPNCGTYNPEGRTTCWRCDKELPKQPPRRRDPRRSERVWLYVAFIVLVLGTAVRMCGNRTPFSIPTPASPQGRAGNAAPVAERIGSHDILP